MILILCGVFWLDTTIAKPGIILLPVAILVTLLASSEFIRLTTDRDLGPQAGLVYGGSIFIVLVSGIPYLSKIPPLDCPLSNLGIAMLAFVAACIVAFITEIASYKTEINAIPRLGLTVLGIFYIGLLIGMLTLLRFIDNDRWQSLPLISLIVTVKMGDIGAYTVGRLVGKHRLTKQLSPGKTIEGVVGGTLFSVAGSFFALRILPAWMQLQTPRLDAWQIATYGILMGLAGVLGDLAESLIKRGTGQKDSSGWLPGFGGILDLIDSLLLAGPLSYLFWLCATQ